MRRLAVPGRPGELQVEDIQLERQSDHLRLRIRLTNGAAFAMPISDETARDLGRALMTATDRILIAR